MYLHVGAGPLIIGVAVIIECARGGGTGAMVVYAQIVVEGTLEASGLVHHAEAAC